MPTRRKSPWDQYSSLVKPTSLALTHFLVPITCMCYMRCRYTCFCSRGGALLLFPPPQADILPTPSFPLLLLLRRSVFSSSIQLRLLPISKIP